MAIALLLAVGGLVLLIQAANQFVTGAARIAVVMRISPVIVGAVIIGFGTSLPEILVSASAASQGDLDLAVGNVIGSNLFNLLAVMPIPGLLRPEILDPAVLTRDYSAMASATFVLALAVYLGRLRAAAPVGHSYVGRSVGMLLVTMYGLYYYWLYLTI